MPIVANTPLLMFLEMRHHAGDSVAVLLVDEQREPNCPTEKIRLNNQAAVLRTASLLKIPVWVAEIGKIDGHNRTVGALLAAAGIRDRDDAIEDGNIFSKPGTNALNKATPLAEKLQGLKYLVVMGREAACCVSDTIEGRGSPGVASECTVLTSPQIVREDDGPLRTSVTNNPSCFVFDNVGTELWQTGPVPFPVPLPPIPIANQ